MRLTLLILAIDAERELARILPELHCIGDELVIGIDDTTTDATAEVARRFTDRIYPVPHAGYYGRGRPEDLNAVECILPRCRGDWVLRVDQDETLSPLWHDKGYVDALLEDRVATQYLIPRRWVAPPGDRYYCGGRLFPDYQLRLYRNIPSLIEFNRRPHARPQVAGEQRFLSDSWLLHWDAVWYDPARREQKIASYVDLGYARQECFQEDYAGGRRSLRMRPLDYAYPSPSVVLAGTPPRDERFAAAIEVLDFPDVVRAGTTEPVLLGIKNCSNRTLLPSSVFLRRANAFVSYHWYTAGHEVYRWDHARNDLPKPIVPGECASHFFSVTAPEQPGNYFLQPDLVEEGVAWFSHHSAIPCRAVRVI